MRRRIVPIWKLLVQTMMGKPIFHLLLLLLLLGLSCLLPLGAVPASRSLSYQKLNQESPVLSITGQDTIEEQPAVLLDEALLVRGRMDIQSFNDYPGSGANNRHDPKTPGRP